MQNKNRGYHLSMVILFLFLISAPLLDGLFPFIPRVALDERRPLADFPRLEPTLKGLGRMPGLIEAYFNDHHGLRSLMVYATSRFRAPVVGLEVAGQVLVGKEGWFYITDNETLDDYRGLKELRADQLWRMKRKLERWNDWLKERGIAFLVFIAPAKWELYPEFLPDAFNRVKPDTALDQLSCFLSGHSEVAFLDLRGALRAEKNTHPVYKKTCTHWSLPGILAAARAVRTELAHRFPDLVLDPLPPYDFEPGTFPPGDMAALMGLKGWLEEQDFRLEPREPLPELDGDLEPAGIGSVTRVTRLKAPFKSPRAVVFHDSFGAQMIPLLAPSLKESLFVWKDHLDEDVIVREHPDLVLLEMGQRNMVEKILSAPDPPVRADEVAGR